MDLDTSHTHIYNIHSGSKLFDPYIPQLTTNCHMPYKSYLTQILGFYIETGTIPVTCNILIFISVCHRCSRQVFSCATIAFVAYKI